MKIPTFNPATALRLVAFGLAAALLASCGQPSPEKLMASAKEYLAKGDRNAAVIELKNLLTKVPDNGEARLMLGQAMLDGEDFVSAEKELQRALELKQPYEKVVPAYVSALLGQGKYRAVVAEVQKYKLFDPTAVAATQTALADAQMKLGNRALAGEAYAAALAAVPGYPRARLGEAILVAIDGRIDEAMKEIGEVIASDPKLAEARMFLADVLLAKGDSEAAKSALEAAISANERYLPPRLTLISMQIDEGQFDSAQTLLESTRRVAPLDVRVNYLDASLAFRKGDKERARQQIQAVLKHLPDYVPALVVAGAIDLEERQLAAAETKLRRAVALAPGHFSARQLLVQTYLRGGQPMKAKEVLQPLMEKGTLNTQKLQMLAGETYLASGDILRATEFYQAAAKWENVDQVAARTRLGQIALATGRNDEGFKELEIASSLDGGRYQADLALITALLRRNEFKKALAAVQALEKKQPDNPLTYQMYGVVYLANKDTAAARESFEKALALQPSYLPAAYNLAQLDVLQGRPEQSRKRYEAMIAREPANEQIYIALAELQARIGVPYKEIAATLQRGVAADTQSAPVRVALISLLLRAGEVQAASTAARDAVAAIPSEPHVLDIAGIAQESAGEISQAIETYNKLAAIQPQSSQPWYRLAALYVRQGETDKAIESLRRVQKMTAPHGEATQKIVQILVAAKRYDEAIKEARNLQRQRPKFAGGYVLEGDIRLAQRQFIEAERSYREALRLEPRASAVAVKVHIALLAAGKGAQAGTWSKKWIADHPRDVLMRMHLAERELSANNLKASAAHYHEVISIAPTNATALNNLAWIGGELGDERALGYAERAVRLVPDNPSFLDTQAMLLVKSGDAGQALPLIERAVKLAPARNDLRVHYAKALIKVGRKDEARKELEALQGVKENFPGKEEVAGLLKGL